MNNYYSLLVDKIKTEPWRYYHGTKHIDSIIAKDTKNKLNYLFAVFHDWVYVPSSSTNEDDSIKVMEELYNGEHLYVLKRLIKLSKHTYQHYSDVDFNDWRILQNDLLVFLDLNTNVYETEYAVFKEYQQYNFKDYKAGRIQVLNSFKSKLQGLKTNIDERIKFVENFNPKIGIFVGSFNPFHSGHNNILEKAEAIFDKVVVAIGQNSAKQSSGSVVDIFEKLKYREVVEYYGLLTDFINGYGDAKPTVIRGLRNGNDLSYEQNFANVLRDINGGVPLNVVYITCDNEFSYISSSVVRELKSLNISLYE